MLVEMSLDFRSRGGRLAADVQAVVAADYIRNLRDECIKGLNGRLKQGYYPFRAPIGYLDNGRGQPKTLDPLRAGLVREAFELYSRGVKLAFLTRGPLQRSVNFCMHHSIALKNSVGRNDGSRQYALG